MSKNAQKRLQVHVRMLYIVCRMLEKKRPAASDAAGGSVKRILGHFSKITFSIGV